MTITSYYVEPAHFRVDRDDIFRIRQLVFVVEQGIPEDLEFDGMDPDCLHVLARSDGGLPIGTGRLAADGSIGRVAVLSEWRRQGVGSAIVRALIDIARHRCIGQVKLTAQAAAHPLYRRMGFATTGNPFEKAGILHQPMYLDLTPPPMIQRQTAEARPASVEPERMDGIDATLTASLALLNDTRRRICVYSQDLEIALYGHKPLVEAFKQFAIRHRHSDIRLIIRDPSSLRHLQHPLIDLAQRLSSRFCLRTPVESEDLQFLPAYIANDSDGYWFRPIGNRYEGHWSPKQAARARQLLEEFDKVWERSRVCSEFRALSL
ncbi:GNAT family N-acetyltransferase [Methylomonas rhizoryzae]|uniref:GNAT family N-acetyltransferase n=1 Tax=Methylomonas rhizoryzae TaxID=2608981 RepID=UPI0012328E6A|nr:GNAT family N-acetyltransferase [Methylomonas rhizoryzae]